MSSSTTVDEKLLRSARHPTPEASEENHPAKLSRYKTKERTLSEIRVQTYLWILEPYLDVTQFGPVFFLDIPTYIVLYCILNFGPFIGLNVLRI